MNPRYGLFKRSKLCALIIRVIFLETIVGGASTVSENGFETNRDGVHGQYKQICKIDSMKIFLHIKNIF